MSLTTRIISYRVRIFRAGMCAKRGIEPLPPCVTVEENEDVSVGSLGVAPCLADSNPTPGSLVLPRQQSAYRGAAAAKAVGNGLLRQARATPAPGALLARLAGPSQHDQREEKNSEENCCGRCHRVVCVVDSVIVSQNRPVVGPYCHTL